MNSLTFGAVIESDDRLVHFRSVYETYESLVRKTLFWLVPSDVIDDLVQETFVRIWEKVSDFREESALKTWIYRITVNMAYDHLRRVKSHERSARQAQKEIAASAAPPAEGSYAAHELIQKGMRILSLKERMVFVLFYKQELSIEAIAVTLKLPVGTVKSRLHNARKTFVQYLEKNGVTP